MAYYVTIEELVSKKFKIDAHSIEDAMNIAEQRYNQNGTEVTEWIEF